MPQLIFIRWGEAFDSEEQYYEFLEEFEYNPFETGTSWRKWLEAQLGSQVQFICPDMPCRQNATYRAWKIRFEKLFPYLDDANGEGVILIGSSLGGWFLSKYLAENTFPKAISQLHLVATPISAAGIEWEWAADFGFDQSLLPRLAEQAKAVFVYHSTDDDVVPYQNAELLMHYIPQAKLTTYADKGHFFVAELTEILENIRRSV